MQRRRSPDRQFINPGKGRVGRAPTTLRVDPILSTHHRFLLVSVNGGSKGGPVRFRARSAPITQMGVTALFNPQALRTRFDEAFPSPVRTAVLASRPEDMLENTAGIAYRGGVFWVALLGSGDSRRYRVSSVNIPTQGSEADPTPRTCPRSSSPGIPAKRAARRSRGCSSAT